MAVQLRSLKTFAQKFPGFTNKKQKQKTNKKQKQKTKTKNKNKKQKQKTKKKTKQKKRNLLRHPKDCCLPH